MNTLRIFVTWLLALTVSTPALAGDLQASIAKAAQQPGQAGQAGQAYGKAIEKKYVWTAGVLIVTGMTMALSEFLESGESEVGQAGPPRGSSLARANAGLGLAVTGAVVLALGHARAARAPAVTFSPDGVTVSKRVSW